MNKIYVYSDAYRDGNVVSLMDTYNQNYIELINAMKTDTPEYSNATYILYWLEDKGYKAKIDNKGLMDTSIVFLDDKEFLEFVLKYL
jgi:hypothetical protein